MSNATLAGLKRLVQYLDATSLCIQQFPDEIGLNNIRPQLKSLKLVLDRNRDALQIQIDGHVLKEPSEWK